MTFSYLLDAHRYMRVHGIKGKIVKTSYGVWNIALVPNATKLG